MNTLLHSKTCRFMFLISSSIFLLLIYLSLASLCFASATDANSITVVGQNNSSVDRPAIQAAINNATPGSTIKLLGTFQLDGKEIYITKSNLIITGVDNRKTVVKGLTVSSSSLEPVSDNGPPDYSFFNRGFHIGSADGSLSITNVTIKNIKFQSLHKAISISPQLAQNTLLCSDNSYTTNSYASNIQISDNWFDNNDRAFQIFGNGDHILFKDNLITHNHDNHDIFVNGLATGCLNEDGSENTILLNSPTYLTFQNNTSESDTPYSYSINLELLGVNHAVISGNNFKNTSGGDVLALSGSYIQAFGNNLDGGGKNAALGNGPATGILVAALSGIDSAPLIPSSNNLISNNNISNSLPAILVETATSGYTFLANKITRTVYGDPDVGDPNLGDVLFCDDGSSNTLFCSSYPGVPSSHNILVTPYCLNIFDLGINNKLFGLFSLSDNISVPPSGVCELHK